MRLTHIQKLRGAEDSTREFLEAIDPLRVSGRLGPILFQLPPNFQCDSKRLGDYLKLLPETYRYAFEFRHASWLNDEVHGLLREHNAALCIAESDTFEVPEVITADFVYFRLRKQSYPEEDLAAIRENSRKILNGGSDLYLFFKHEEDPAGAIYAEGLLATQ